MRGHHRCPHIINILTLKYKFAQRKCIEDITIYVSSPQKVTAGDFNNVSNIESMNKQCIWKWCKYD